MNVTQVPGWFRETLEGQRLVQQHEAQLAAKRVELAAERAAALSERDKSIAAILKSETKAKAALDAASAVVAERLASLREIQAERTSLSARFERTIAGLERQLCESCDSVAIDSFLSELEARRSRDLLLQSESSERKSWGGTDVIVTRSNARSVSALNEALLAARKKAEALRLSASRDVAAEIGRIRDSLPSVKMEKIEQHTALVGV